MKGGEIIEGQITVRQKIEEDIIVGQNLVGFSKFNDNLILLEANFRNLIIDKPSLRSCIVLDTNKQTNRQA